MMKLREIEQSIGALPPKELAKLDAWLHSLLEDRESKKRACGVTKQHEVLQSHPTAHMTYLLERVRCGKENCKETLLARYKETRVWQHSGSAQ